MKKKRKPKKILKRKKNEGLVAYFERWADQGPDINLSNPQAPKWGPIGVSWNIWRRINGIINES